MILPQKTVKTKKKKYQINKNISGIFLIPLMTAILATEINGKESGVKLEEKSTLLITKKPASKNRNDKKKEPDYQKKAKHIEEILNYGTNEERIKAINDIPAITDESIKKRLSKKIIELMKDEGNNEVLVKAITTLGEMKVNESIPLCIEKLDHPSAEVKTSAVYTLKQLKGIKAKSKLIGNFKKEDLNKNSNYIEALINTLGEFNAVELLPYVDNALKENKCTKLIRGNLVLFLGQLKSGNRKEILFRLYRDPEEDITVRAYAANSLSKMNVREAATDFKKTLEEIESYPFKKKQKYYTLYIYSIAALARLGDKAAIPKLIQALRSDNDSVRLKAINLIKDLKDKRTIDILKYKMKYDSNPKVKEAAKKALEEMGVKVDEE